MILPIQTYGKDVLRQQAKPIDSQDEAIHQFVEDMFESMYAAEGIGLAAPQVDRSIRVFIVDISPMDETESRRVFLNPRILEFGPEKDNYEEGCLSLPTIHESVTRPTSVRISYETLDGEKRDEWIDGFLARVIQHEYDHLEGVLFIDHLSGLKRSLLRKTLNKIASGEIEVESSENYQL